MGSSDGDVYAWHHDGTLLDGWPQTTGDSVSSSPALGDLDGDGGLDVVVGSGDANVYAWHANGTALTGWPQSTGDWVESSPALGDLDGDGDLEVVVGSDDYSVYAWHDDGTPVEGWPQTTGFWVDSSPALGDLDGDGDLEVVVGSFDGYVYAWHDDGTTLAGWPQGAETPYAGFYSSPALGDLDGDGDLEVVIGCDDGKVYAWHDDGSPVAGWPTTTGNVVWGSAALGDLNGDGDVEVVVGSDDHNVYAWHGDGSPVAGWPQATWDWVDSSPALGDLDGDGDLEVVIGSFDFDVYAWHGDGSPVAGWPLSTEDSVPGSPALGDLDGDGDVEVVVGSDDSDVYAWSGDTPTSDVLAWPMFRHDRRRTGSYHVVAADAGPDKTIGLGGSTTLEGSASGGIPPYSYSWSPTTGLDNPSIAQPTASPASTTEYTLTVTDDIGQSDDDSMTVTVASGVVADAGPDKSIGLGGATTLEGSASGGVPPYTYSWSPTTGLDNPSIAQPTASPTSTTEYTLTVTDDIGQTDDDTMTVTVTSAGVAVLSSGYVMPEAGDTSTLFTWRIKYWNTLNTAPTSVWVGIHSSATGTTRWGPMWGYDPSDTNYVDGKWYTYSSYLRGGNAAYRFAAQVESEWVYWPRPAGSYRDGPDVNPLVLSSGYLTPTSGTHSTDFTWRVRYWNTLNQPPDEVWCAIWWGSRGQAFWYPMWAFDPSDTNYADGKWYTVHMRWLDSSAHAYRFAARQGANWAYWPKPAGAYLSGPTVSP